MDTSEPNDSLTVWLYGLLWLFYLYLFVSIFRFSTESSSNLIIAGMHLINFGVHEVSHLLTIFLPPLFTALAGSLGEISFTFLLLFVAIRAKSYFAAIFTSLWVMLGFISVGRYVADARAQQMQLMGPGENLQHDWNYILSQLGLLEHDILIGGILRWIGISIGVCALSFGLYIIAARLLVRSA